MGGYGINGHLGISAQQSFGTATSSWDYMPILSESLTTNVEELIEESLQGRFEQGASHEGLLTVAGDIVFEPHPQLLGHFLRGALGQASGTIVSGTSAQQWEVVPTQTDFDAELCALPPFTLQLYRSVGSAWQFTDSIVNGLSLEIGGGSIVRATANMICRVSSLMTKTTPAFPTDAPWIWDAASVSIAGAAYGDFENLTLTINNNVEGVTLLDTTKLHAMYKRNGNRTFGVSGNVAFKNQTEYGLFRAQTEQRLQVHLLGLTEASSGAYESLNLDAPKMRYKSWPVAMGGPNRISVGVEGNLKYDTTSSYALRALLVNSRAAYEN